MHRKIISVVRSIKKKKTSPPSFTISSLTSEQPSNVNDKAQNVNMPFILISANCSRSLNQIFVGVGVREGKKMCLGPSLNSQTHIRLRPKIFFFFFGGYFSHPITKSATLNRLLHCSLWQYSGALFFSFFEGPFLHFGGEIARSPV